MGVYVFASNLLRYLINFCLQSVSLFAEFFALSLNLFHLVAYSFVLFQVSLTKNVI